MINPFYYSIPTRVRDKAFIKMLQPAYKDKILDVGCGLGYFTNLLASRNALTDGIDIDKECIKYCRKYMHGRYRAGDIHELPYSNEYYDKVLCTEVLEHVNHNELILAQIYRVMKKGGILVASVPCSEGIFGKLFKNIGHNSVDENTYEYHWHKGYTKDELVKLLEENGFKYESHYYTLVAGTEMFTGISKVLIRILQAKKIDSQANALLIEKSLLWRIYTKIFPILWWFSKLEQPLGKIIKGHMIIVKAVKI